MAARIAFTLPISCHICLGKVKEPVACSNRHAFCKECIELWTEKSAQCPTCRTDISTENPCRPILGGLNSQAGVEDQVTRSSRELRRVRIELACRDYEDEIDHLQLEVARQKETIAELKQCGATHPISSVILDPATEGSDPPPVSGGATGPDILVQRVQGLKGRLRKVTGLYDGARTIVQQQKTEIQALKDSHAALDREIQSLKLDVMNRSPRRFGRYTVGALESRVQSSDREILQLNRALERSDAFILELTAERDALRTALAAAAAGHSSMTAAQSCGTNAQSGVTGAGQSDVTVARSGVTDSGQSSTNSVQSGVIAAQQSVTERSELTPYATDCSADTVMRVPTNFTESNVSTSRVKIVGTHCPPDEIVASCSNVLMYPCMQINEEIDTLSSTERFTMGVGGTEGTVALQCGDAVGLVASWTNQNAESLAAPCKKRLRFTESCDMVEGVITGTSALNDFH